MLSISISTIVHTHHIFRILFPRLSLNLWRPLKRGQTFLRLSRRPGTQRHRLRVILARNSQRIRLDVVYLMKTLMNSCQTNIRSLFVFEFTGYLLSFQLRIKDQKSALLNPMVGTYFVFIATPRNIEIFNSIMDYCKLHYTGKQQTRHTKILGSGQWHWTRSRFHRRPMWSQHEERK